MLDQSTAAWNARDLAGFIACYENSPETIYLTTAQVVIGYTAIHKMYFERFTNDDWFRRGVLSTSLLHVASLGSEYALARGRYLLNGDATHGGPTNGMFSLVLRRAPAGWRILADHTF
jgi:ketosteroid isomerase-like protein